MGIFVKFLGPGYFLDFMNYFSKEKSYGIGPQSVDRVHGGRSMGPWTFIKLWSLIL
jgi:hypothetical protein